MRAKVSADSTSILSDAEVLQMFLYGINSRGDTKPVVKALLAKFRNISNIITADKAELRSVKGVWQCGHYSLSSNSRDRTTHEARSYKG